MMTSKIPLIKLNNGVEMPALGLGVFQNTPAQMAAAVEAALNAGCRLIDTAAAYGNERQVGEAVRASGIARPDLFITTKLWVTDFGYDEALRAFDMSMKKLGLDYIDLYMLHWPTPSVFETTVESYRALEKLVGDKRVRAIGVSNFNANHLENLIVRSSITPAVNQIELHPFFAQSATREANRRLGIVTQAWSPLGGAYSYRGPAQQVVELSDPRIIQLAEKKGKSPAQIILRWHLQNGVSAIPKSVTPGRIFENFAVFDFELSAEDLAAIDAMDTGVRAGLDPETTSAATFGHRQIGDD